MRGNLTFEHKDGYHVCCLDIEEFADITGRGLEGCDGEQVGRATPADCIQRLEHGGDL